MKHAWLLIVAAACLWYGLRDPKPAPTPEPPSPVVVVKPPFDVDGLRVLIVYESEDAASKLASVVLASEWRSYVTSKGGKFRCLDDDVDISGDEPEWAPTLAKVVKDARPLPWVIVSNGKTGFEGPLPLGDGELLTLVKRYGGE